MNKKKKILIALLCVFFISLATTLVVSFSNETEGNVLIKNITPIYDENSGVIVNNNEVVFNDKNQEVKYNVAIENTQNYDVIINDLTLSTPTEEFLNYELDINKNEVIEANSIKEIVVLFKTVQMEGWGRNFNDELTANIKFTKVNKLDPIPTPEEDKKEDIKDEIKEEKPQEEQTQKEETPSQNEEIKDEEVTIPNDELINNIEDTNVDDNKENREEVTKKEEIKEQEDKKTNNKNNGKKVLLAVSIVITSASGILIIVLIVKGKNKKTIAIMLITLGLGATLVNADEVIELPITFNVSFKSQNVMKPSGWEVDYPEDMNPVITKVGTDFWAFAPQIVNIYIENEIPEIPDFKYEFDVSDTQNGRVKAYIVDSTYDGVCYDLESKKLSCYDLYLQADGIIYPNSNMEYYFGMMLNLNKIDGLSNLDTSEVTNMRGMFAYTGYASQNVELDLKSLDTSNVTNMFGMFYNVGYSDKDFILDVSNFDTSQVTDMSSMFNNAGHNSTEFTLDVSNFDTSKVTNMLRMFYYTGYASTEFTLDLSNFDTSNVTNMSSMFSQTGYNSTEFTLDVSNFDTSKVTDMSWMFNHTGCNSTKFTLDLSNFDTSNVTNMVSMFNQTGYNSTELTLDVSNFDTSKVTNMSWMFNHTGYNSTTFTLDVSNFDTSKVTDMSYMFNHTGHNSTEFTLDVSNFDTSKVTDMSQMFRDTGYNSTKLNTTITIRNPNLTSYYNVFYRVATKPGSQIKVNYTNATSLLVDSMIATKSSNSNVTKGDLVD